MAANSSRPTAAQHAVSHVETDKRLSSLERGLRDVRKKSTTKTHYIASAHRRILAFEGELVQLRKELNEQGSSPALLGKIESLEGAFATFLKEFEELKDRVGKLEVGQTNLAKFATDGLRDANTKIDETTAIAEKALGRATSASDKADANATAIARLAGPSEGWKVGSVIVAIFVGIIAGILWNIVDFSSKTTVKDGTITITSVADATWVAWVFGFAFGVTVLSVLLSIGGFVSRQATSSASASASASATAPAAPTAPSAPTQPLPVAVTQQAAKPMIPPRDTATAKAKAST